MCKNNNTYLSRDINSVSELYGQVVVYVKEAGLWGI
jgi:hypothetical protein